jgi:hypothetical protein
MFFFPAFALAAVFATDLYSLTLVSPFRAVDQVLWETIVGGCDNGYAGCGSFWSLAWRVFLTLALVIVQIVLSWRAYCFQVATSGLLEHTAQWKRSTVVPDITG